MQYLLEEKDLTLNNKSIVYFYAHWMPGHNKMLTMLEKFKSKYNDKFFWAVDVDHFKGLCRKFNVNSIPTVIYFENNKEIKRINGLILTSAFKNFLTDI